MSGTIVDFSVQNAAAAKSTTQYIRFNQIFSEGDLPEGESLNATVGTKAVALQMDVLSRYADGSVKSAILTVAAPAIAAGATLQGSLTASSATTTGAAIATDAALAHGYDLTVNMDISGLGAVTINAAKKLAAAVASNDFKVIRGGALASEISFDVAVTRALRVTFNVVTYADGSVSTKVSFQNDAAMGATGGTVLFNSLSIVEGGATRFSKTNLTQYQYQVWAQDITQDSGAKQTLNIRHDIDYLERTGAIWNYDLTARVSGAPSVPSSWTNVLGVNGLFQYMPTTGGRPDIGPTTEANARWLITQDASAAAYALAQDQAAGSIPWHYYENTKGHYLSVADYPKLWIDYRGVVQPSQIDGGESGWTADRSHSPDVSYVAWLLTGDRYHLDMLNAQVSWVIGNTWNDPRQDARGIVANGVDEVRAQAWSLRAVQEAAYANPDGSDEKAYFTKIANNNWSYLRTVMTTLSVSQGQVHGYVEGNYRQGGVTTPWQQDFFASATALAALQGNNDARAVLKWEANFLSGRFLSPDLNPYNGFDYNLNVYTSSGTALTSWADVAAATRAAGNYQTGPSSGNAGYYAELAAMSNANIISVFAGGEDPTDHRVAADAMRAYGWILAAGMPNLRTDPQYQVVPRMPDGTQIGAREMHVVAPLLPLTTVTFTGNNAFIYDHGVGLTSLNGTAGADVLIDNSIAGGDRLAGKGGDDYLIGGTGTNIFAPGDGNDYALIRGRAARFEVSATSAGRLEIEGFRVGTDIIALTGAISLKAIVASAVSDGFGGTLITISPERTIRLNGIAPSKIRRAMFDVSGGVPIDVILGTVGKDMLLGTSGLDTMQGGLGNDIYIVNVAGDIVVELAAQGTDTIRSTINYTLPSNVENLVLTGSGNRSATGNSLVNTLTGNSGNNVLNGKAGADTMKGGKGDDTYYVDNAGDAAIEKSGGGSDQINSSVSFDLAVAGQYVERLTLTGSGNINGRGNSLDNTLTGNAGNNVLKGRAGADTMAGGAGNDTYYVNHPGDLVQEAPHDGVDQVFSSVSYSLAYQYIENLTLTGDADLSARGNSRDNALTGNSGDNQLSGRGGADVMTGGGGSDQFRFGSPLVAGEVDTITDFSVGDDTIRLSSSVFNTIVGTGTLSKDQFAANASGTAQDASDRIIYETDTGKLFYDSNGSAAGGATQFATLSPGLGLANADFSVI